MSEYIEQPCQPFPSDPIVHGLRRHFETEPTSTSVSGRNACQDQREQTADCETIVQP